MSFLFSESLTQSSMRVSVTEYLVATNDTGDWQCMQIAIALVVISHECSKRRSVAQGEE